MAAETRARNSVIISPLITHMKSLPCQSFISLEKKNLDEKEERKRMLPFLFLLVFAREGGIKLHGESLRSTRHAVARSFQYQLQMKINYRQRGAYNEAY